MTDDVETTEPNSRNRRHRALERLSARIPALEKSIETVLGEPLHQRLGSRPIGAKPDQAMRLMTFNMAHGRRRVPHQALIGRQRVERNVVDIARVIDGLEADVVALQEADGPSAWSGNFDHVATLAIEAKLADHYRGEHNPFRVGRHDLASGTALLSRWPLHEPLSHRFGSNWRCTKGFVAASVEVPAFGGQTVDLVSAHLDFLAPHLRRRQIGSIIRTLRGRDNPLVVLGDLNCCWAREPASLALLTRQLRLRAYQPHDHRPTYPAYRPRRRLDWILISEELDFADHRRVPTKLSDHLGVVADLVLRA